MRSQGLVVRMHFFPYSRLATRQIIFAIRDTVTNDIFLQAEFDGGSKNIRASHFKGSSLTEFYKTPEFQIGAYQNRTTLHLTNNLDFEKWNLLIFEIVQGMPTSFDDGYHSLRVVVNGIAEPRIYFGYIKEGEVLYPNNNGNQLAIDLCSSRLPHSPDRNFALDGDYDVLNFLWLHGAAGIDTSPSILLFLWNSNLINLINKAVDGCAIFGFVFTAEPACLSCKDGYYLSDHECVLECPDGSFLHPDTKSCQSKCQY